MRLLISKCLIAKRFHFSKKQMHSKKNEKMKSRTFIEYLIKYDFINFFRVWNSKKDDVSDYRDVIFNETKFFDAYKAVDLFKKEKKNLCNVSCDFVANIWEQRWEAIRQNINTKTRIK
jgi:hypothetical protein